MLEPATFKNFDAPVPGGLNEMFVPTSSDVHLYADPRTCVSKAPIYFAGCEGHSRQDDPVARRMISKAYRATPARGGRSEAVGKPTYADRIAHHFETASHREYLRWGHLRYVNTTGGQGDRAFRRVEVTGEVDPTMRQQVVSQLYPRLLYAFSDAVCFVQNNTRHNQDMFDTLFDWALQGHEKTINQRVRPGVIILNKSTELVHDTLGTPENATRRILEAHAKSSRFREMQLVWTKRNQRVRTAEDLIHCYYYALNVVSIPTYGSEPPVASQMSEALKELYTKIREMSERIRKKRRSCNMDTDVSSFNSYVECAARKLAWDFKAAVDLHETQMSSGDPSVPTRFSEHMAQLMSNMAKLRRLEDSDERRGEAQLVEEIIPFIASCIATKVSQTDSKETMRQTRIIAYEARVGLQMFRDKSWRCEAMDPRTHRRCRNYREGHEKGHQFEASARPATSASIEDSLAEGQHESSYDGDKYMRLLWDAIHSVSGGGLDGEGTEKRKLADTAQSVGVNLVQSQRTCLSYLSNCPTNTLPCRGVQHSICEACIRRYMRGYDPSWAHLTQSPLGCELWTTPWRIRVKPETAGPRVPSLDGGGIRGLVELKTLARLQEVGFGIKIQDLFDLVIGTSTGGIVALGVFEKGWTLTEAIPRFRDLATRAFEFCRALKLPLYSKFAVPFCSFKYKTAGIVSALQESFGDDFLFGQPRGSTHLQESDSMSVPSAQDQVKGGVVACLEGRNQPCLIANYSINPLSYGSEQDILQREDEQEKDFRTWQAARATSAAHTFFKPYYREDARRTYVDGAVIRNNPVQVAFDKSRKIWPSCRPDIIVSLGTGIMVDEGGNHASTKNLVMENLKAVFPARILKKLETGFNMVESTLSCHRAWSDFQQSHIFDPRLGRNLHRIDVGIMDEHPKLDDVSEIASLIDRCDNYLAQGWWERWWRLVDGTAITAWGATAACQPVLLLSAIGGIYAGWDYTRKDPLPTICPF